MTTASPPDGSGMFGWITGAKSLLDAATSGDLEAEPEMADELISLAQDMYDYLNTELREAQWLREPLPLSSTTAAKWTSNLMQQVAGDESGLLTRLQQFQEGLPHWIAALKEAKKRYQETEVANVDTISRLGPDI